MSGPGAERPSQGPAREPATGGVMSQTMLYIEDDSSALL